jgi:hypothetical protein
LDPEVMERSTDLARAWGSPTGVCLVTGSRAAPATAHKCPYRAATRRPPWLRYVRTVGGTSIGLRWMA